MDRARGYPLVDRQTNWKHNLPVIPRTRTVISITPSSNTYDHSNQQHKLCYSRSVWIYPKTLRLIYFKHLNLRSPFKECIWSISLKFIEIKLFLNILLSKKPFYFYIFYKSNLIRKKLFPKKLPLLTFQVHNLQNLPPGKGLRPIAYGADPTEFVRTLPPPWVVCIRLTYVWIREIIWLINPQGHAGL